MRPSVPYGSRCSYRYCSGCHYSCCTGTQPASRSECAGYAIQCTALRRLLVASQPASQPASPAVAGHLATIAIARSVCEARLHGALLFTTGHSEWLTSNGPHSGAFLRANCNAPAGTEGLATTCQRSTRASNLVLSGQLWDHLRNSDWSVCPADTAAAGCWRPHAHARTDMLYPLHYALEWEHHVRLCASY